MDNNQVIHRMAKALIMVIIFFSIMILFSLSMASCSTTKYVDRPYPVPEIHEVHSTDTIFKSDSVYVKDSVATEVKNDTIHYHHYHTKYQTKWNGKTYIKRVCDSVPYPVPYEIEKAVPTYDEDMMPWYKKVVLHIGYGVLIALVTFVIIFVVRRWRK